MIKKAIYYAVLAGCLSLATAAAYFGVAKFLRDRQSVVTQLSRPPIQERRALAGTRRTTAPERGRGQTAAPQPGGPSAAAAAGEAAIERQLKTLDEINRINEMNRRLQEQQRRMQNQH